MIEAKNIQPDLIPPHGGKLVPLLLEGDNRAGEMERAESLPRVRMTSRETSDLIMMAIGAFSPLAGFMCRADYESVVNDMRLKDGTLWPIPIALSVAGQEAARCEEGREVSLIDDESGELMGIMRVEEKFSYNKRREAKEVFGTDESAHPGVSKVYSQGDVLIGGAVRVFSERDYPRRFGAYYARPADTRRIFQQKGWKTVSAFQIRNPIHRSHEYCMNMALDRTDGLLIHPLVGKLRQGDIPAEIRMKCYRVLLEKYYPSDRVVCKVYPLEMRYAGPREAVLHAILRQNYGCTHLIVGRDHAGTGNYYGPYDAQNIFDSIHSGDLLIKPIKIDAIFWCYECGRMTCTKTCDHPESSRLIISGTELRSMLEKGKTPPKEFSRPEVLEILRDYYRDIRKQGGEIGGKNG